MATINYVTLKMPEILWKESEIIQDTPSFEVRKYKFKKGIIFRIPHDIKPSDICHAFLEHEINMSNTLRTGTLTMKIQVTFIPCHMGIFSGFETLNGSYECIYNVEDYGDEYFKPDYENPENIKNIVPLPPNMKTNLNKYLNEILFKYTDNSDLISKYAIDLGCQRKKIKANFLPAPIQTSTSKNGAKAFQLTIDFFNDIILGTCNMLPEKI